MHGIRYLYLLLEVILYAAVVPAYALVFSRYRFNNVLENKVEAKKKSRKAQLMFFLGVFFTIVLFIFVLWARLHRDDPHHVGYFTSFLVGGLLTLAYFNDSLPRVDLLLCLPAMAIVWLCLLVFEALLLHYNAGWVYTDSTVLMITLPGNVTLILENLIFFYVFAPYMSVVIFTGLARRRSDRAAFWITIVLVWVSGAVWEVISMGVFNLWYMIEDRSVLPFNLLGARTTIEEMLYYVPFSAISILVYLALFYRKYRYYDAASAPTAT